MHFTLNGRTVEASPDDPEMPLLYLLRGDAFALSGPKFGCGLAQCGACTVLLDGVATRSCAIPAEAVDGRAVTTLEGLGTPASPHPLQAAFVAENAAQCGYCANGMILQSADLLARDPRPTEAAIREALAHNLCRCGTHQRIVKAVQRAASTVQRATSAGPAR
jgi:nicotinate dehydrogenase subunit A